MKCIKFVDGRKVGQIDNVVDAEAFTLVSSKVAVFTTRSEWKEKTRPFLKKIAPVVSEAIKEQKKNENRIGKSIASGRKAKEMTQDELASKLGVDKKDVSNWERGKEFADDDMINKIEKIIEKKVK